MNLSERLPDKLQPSNLWRSFHGELSQDNDAKPTPLLIVWILAALVDWKSGGGKFEQITLASLAGLEGLHQALMAGQRRRIENPQEYERARREKDELMRG